MALPLAFDPIAEARRQWEAHWGADALDSMTAVTSVMRAHQILLARLNDLLAPWDLTFPRYEALMLLFYSRRGELPLGKMGDRLQVHRASVTNVVDRLAEQGLIERRRHDSDRRTILAAITADGRRVARAATKKLNAAQFATEPLTAEQCGLVFELMTPMREHAGDFLERSAHGGQPPAGP